MLLVIFGTEENMRRYLSIGLLVSVYVLYTPLVPRVAV